MFLACRFQGVPFRLFTAFGPASRCYSSCFLTARRTDVWNPSCSKPGCMPERPQFPQTGLAWDTTSSRIPLKKAQFRQRMAVPSASSSEPQVYSVWVPFDGGASLSGEAPGGPAAQKTIATLCARHGDALPLFQAHITALGGLLLPQPPGTLASLEQSCAEVAQNTKPFVAALDAVETGTTYFQSVYATFEAEARPLLLRLHQQLEDAMDLHNVRRKPPAPGSTYHPHVSLAYGDLSDERRAALASEAAQVLQQALRKTRAEGKDYQVAGRSAAVLTLTDKIRIPLETAVTMHVDEIALVYTDLSRPTSTWRVTRRFPFLRR